MPKITLIDLQEDSVNQSSLTTASTAESGLNTLYEEPKNRVFFLSKWMSMFWPALTALKNLPVNILAFLLGRASIMGEIAPFGLAFFAAVAIFTANKENGRTAAIGLCALLGVLSAGKYWEAIVYALSMTSYWHFADKLFRPGRTIHTITFLFLGSIFLSSMAVFLWRDSSLYGFLIVMVNTIFCLTLIYAFQYGMPLALGKDKLEENISEQTVCIVFMLAIGVAGLSGLSLVGYSLGNIAGSLFVITLALVGGAGLGAAAGVAIGFSSGLNGIDAASSVAMYALAGLLGGILRDLGKPAVILGFLLGKIVFLLYIAQTNILASHITPAIAEPAMASLLFFLLPINNLLDFGKERLFSKVQAAPAENGLQLAATVEKLDYIAEVLEGFGETVRTASSNEHFEYNNKIKDSQLNEMLAIVGNKVCDHCRHRNDCWDKEFYPIYQSMLEMLALAEERELTEKKVPLPIKSYCTNKSALVDIINQVVENNRIHWYWKKKLVDCRLSSAEQLKATAGILVNLAFEINREPRNDIEAAERLKKQSEELGCPLNSVKVAGNGDMVSVNVQKTVCDNTKECVNTILPLTANILKETMTLRHECGIKSKNVPCRIVMSLAEKYSIEFGAAYAAKGDNNSITNEVCGDSFAHVKLGQGKEALILSDGMGSGAVAANESNAAIMFLRKLLLAGFDIGIAVKTVNSMMLLRSSPDSFATMDMVVIDSYTCLAEFLKVGAASSFIKRVREVSTIDCSSLPAGIIEHIEIEPIKKTLAPGDMVVMVSDGILERTNAHNKESWIVNYLRRLDSDNPQDIATSILRQAKTMNGNSVTDDMTVVVSKIVERRIVH